jgi:hypothetical protein
LNSMANHYLHIGQWQGFYQYGPEYGRNIEGKEAEFRLFIEDMVDGRFKGRCIDWSGFGAEGEVAIVEGFVDGFFISFVKQYDAAFYVDDWGRSALIEEATGHTVEYQGHYNLSAKCFKGRWEISKVVGSSENETIEEFCSGTWTLVLEETT